MVIGARRINIFGGNEFSDVGAVAEALGSEKFGFIGFDAGGVRGINIYDPEKSKVSKKIGRSHLAIVDGPNIAEKLFRFGKFNDYYEEIGSITSWENDGVHMHLDDVRRGERVVVVNLRGDEYLDEVKNKLESDSALADLVNYKVISGSETGMSNRIYLHR